MYTLKLDHSEKKEFDLKLNFYTFEEIIHYLIDTYYKEDFSLFCVNIDNPEIEGEIHIFLSPISYDIKGLTEVWINWQGFDVDLLFHKKEDCYELVKWYPSLIPMNMLFINNHFIQRIKKIKI